MFLSIDSAFADLPCPVSYSPSELISTLKMPLSYLLGHDMGDGSFDMNWQERLHCFSFIEAPAWDPLSDLDVKPRPYSAQFLFEVCELGLKTIRHVARRF